MRDSIDRQAAINTVKTMFDCCDTHNMIDYRDLMIEALSVLPSAQTEDYAELKREFILMASYIDALLECSDEQKENLNWFISRLAKHMPWKERD